MRLIITAIGVAVAVFVTSLVFALAYEPTVARPVADTLTKQDHTFLAELGWHYSNEYQKVQLVSTAMQVCIDLNNGYTLAQQETALKPVMGWSYKQSSDFLMTAHDTYCPEIRLY